MDSRPDQHPVCIPAHGIPATAWHHCLFPAKHQGMNIKASTIFCFRRYLVEANCRDFCQHDKGEMANARITASIPTPPISGRSKGVSRKFLKFEYILQIYAIISTLGVHQKKMIPAGSLSNQLGSAMVSLGD